MSQRLTRQEIKRDEVLEGLGRVVGFLRDHSRTILTGFAAVLVLMAGYVVWRSLESGREERANEQLAAALEPAEAAGAELSAATQGLEAVAADLGGTRAGSIAHAYLGALAAEAEDYDVARQHWEAFLVKHSGHALAAQIERNLISLDRAQGRSEELVQRLRETLANGSSALSEDTVLFELAKSLEELGQVENAIEAYTRLSAEYPDSLFSRQGEARSAALGDPS